MNTERLYQKLLTHYLTALRNEKPDKIPIRPFVAEFVAKYAGYSCQQVCHDYTLAFEAAQRLAHRNRSSPPKARRFWPKPCSL